MKKITIGIFIGVAVVIAGAVTWGVHPSHSVAAGATQVHPQTSPTTTVISSAPSVPPSSATPATTQKTRGASTQSPSASAHSSPPAHHTTRTTHTTPTTAPISPVSTPVRSSTSPTPTHTAPPTVAPKSQPPTSPAPTTTPTSPPAEQYPSLSATVAHQSVASVTQIQADASNPAALGEVPWSVADANTVVQALGSRTAAASTTAGYAETYLYAMLALNDSAFNTSPDDSGAANQLQGSPTNVSRVDQITLTQVQPGFGSLEYDYTVTFTTTSGATETNQCFVAFVPEPTNTAQWILNGVGDLTTE